MLQLVFAGCDRRQWPAPARLTRSRRRTAFVVCACAFIASICAAQQLSFSSITDGLENLNVNCITQDRTGYLWVGTENGLYRFDGRQFTKFGTTEGIRGRTIQSLFVAQDGTLFVGTTAGLYFLRHDGHIAEIRPPAPVEEFSVRIGTVFAQNPSGAVVMSDRSGVFTLNKVTEEQWVAKPLGLEPGNTWSVLYGPDGTLWYGCGFDLCRYDGNKTTHLGEEYGLPKENWLHLLFDRNGHLWLRSWVRVVEVIPAEKRIELHDLPGEGTSAPYNSLALDTNGRVVASQGASLGLWENNAWHMITQKNGLSRFDISSLFLDREGSVWIGLVGHGLMRWVGQDRWEGYTAVDGLSDDVVWSSVRDRSGRLWIGTESGLDWIAPGSTEVNIWKSGSISTVRAASLTLDDKGNIWMGSAAGSLVKINPQTLAGQEWKIHEVYRLMTGPDGRLWIATGSGLYTKDPTTDSPPEAASGPGVELPQQQRYTDLCVDGAKRLWAPSDAGLFRLDPDGWHKIDMGLAGINPLELVAGPDGRLWASGAFQGIVRLKIDGDRVVETEHFLRPHLLSEQIVAIYMDRRGWLWVGQDAGLTVYDGHAWRGFTQSDGLIWNDTDSYAINEDTDGSMWIGTSGGISHLIKPETISNQAPRPPVVADMRFGNEEMANGSSVAWSADPLTISITALNYRDLEHMHFRYRLLGLEKEWVDTTDEMIRYPRLAPGNYRFEAATADESGEEISHVEEVDFRVTPRWWQNQFLQWFMVLLCAFGAAQLWRLRIRGLQVQKQQLEIAVQHRTEDLEREKSELLRAREQMRHYAEHDDLTGLWNHRIIVERLRIEVVKSQRERTPLSVILVDLDHFKQINDTFGHLAGDLALKEMGAIFLRSIRAQDWVGRYGGEEFLLILPGSNFTAARLRAEQLRMAVESASLTYGDRSIQITASFGVASGFPTEEGKLIKIADGALYKAKANGRNCVVSTEV